MKRPLDQSHLALDETMNAPPAKPPGKVAQCVKSVEFPPFAKERAQIGPQKINIRQPVFTPDDHLEKQENPG